MQAFVAYTACMQYTLRNIPEHLDRELRKRAKAQGRSLNEVAIEALLRAFGLSGTLPPQRDLSDIAGSWRDDPETDRALEEQRTIDPELWR